MSKQGKLILLPNTLHEDIEHITKYFPQSVIETVGNLDGLIAESEKAARRYMKKFPFPEGKTFRDMPIRTLSEHTKENELDDLLSPLKQGQVWGLISDAGLPCLADPGARFTLRARMLGIEVDVGIGPSSIILALMLSGLGAQKFCFEGYLPKESEALIFSIKMLQQRSVKEGSTHVFIETPYRCQQMLDALLSALSDRTWLSVSMDLSLPSQQVITKRVAEWKKVAKPDLNKKLCVFVFCA